MAQKKEEKLNERLTVQAMLLKREATAYRKKLIEINDIRKKNGKKRVFESRLVRRLMVKFAESPQETLSFLNYEND
ncbi:MAG: hypothetical protein ACO1G5_03205 [Bacteroidota bacterium]